VDHDPRGVYVAERFAERCGCSVCRDHYHALVRVEDHINRGHNMDARTPASHCGFVG
jgi:hypothetical protein